MDRGKQSQIQFIESRQTQAILLLKSADLIPIKDKQNIWLGSKKQPTEQRNNQSKGACMPNTKDQYKPKYVT